MRSSKKEKEELDASDNVVARASEEGKVTVLPHGVVKDEVFGDLDGKGPNFRAVSSAL